MAYPPKVRSLRLISLDFLDKAIATYFPYWGDHHNVNKQALFSIELEMMSLTLACCESYRRRRSPSQTAWGLKNNQMRKVRFFRWFLTFVVIKRNFESNTIVIPIQIMFATHQLFVRAQQCCAPTHLSHSFSNW
jgi:hypothetical protein